MSTWGCLSICLLLFTQVFIEILFISLKRCINVCQIIVQPWLLWKVSPSFCKAEWQFFDNPKWIPVKFSYNAQSPFPVLPMLKKDKGNYFLEGECTLLPLSRVSDVSFIILLF